MKTVQELAKHYVSFFVEGTRTNGETYTFLAENSPDGLYNLMRLAHNEMLPDDYKYTFIRGALIAIADTVEDEEQDAIQNIEPSCYTSDQLAWLSSNLIRSNYVDSAVCDFGHSETIMGDIMMGMQKEMQEVGHSVLSSLEQILQEEVA